jgi:glycerol transport system ATP-binding protein
MLELRNVSLQVENEVYIKDVSLNLDRDNINILLGPTLSGKTSLMRLMAGLDKPTSGEIFFDGKSVQGVAVQKRNVAMVYQQFINYPTLTVFENIASPLRVAKISKSQIDSRVRQAAAVLQLDEFLTRFPSELSGGQQQRVAIARALVKHADLVLLDEPLANLDYKLREELRSELPALFADLGVVLVYATTEPMEALALGGKTACLHRGQVAQFGATLELYNSPIGLQTAKTFSDPPLNTLEVNRADGSFSIRGDDNSSRGISLTHQVQDNGAFTLGIRPHHLTRQRTSEQDIEFSGTVTVTELTGSESFIHFQCNGNPWVALIHGICDMRQGEHASFFVDPVKVFLFDQNQQLVLNVNSGGVS